MQLGSRRPLVYNVVLARNGAEGGINGAAVTTGNSGGSSGRAWDGVSASVNGSSITYDRTQAALGQASYKMTNGTIQGSSTQLYWTSGSIGSRSAFAGRAYIWLPSRVPAGFYFDIVTFFQAGVQSNGNIIVADNGSVSRVICADAPNGQVGGSVAVNIAAWFRVDWYLTCATSSGSVQARLFNTISSSTADEIVANATGSTNTGTVTDQILYGPAGNQAGSGTSYIANMDEMSVWLP